MELGLKRVLNTLKKYPSSFDFKKIILDPKCSLLETKVFLFSLVYFPIYYLIFMIPSK